MLALFSLESKSPFTASNAQVCPTNSAEKGTGYPLEQPTKTKLLGPSLPVVRNLRIACGAIQNRSIASHEQFTSTLLFSPTSSIHNPCNEQFHHTYPYPASLPPSSWATRSPSSPAIPLSFSSPSQLGSADIWILFNTACRTSFWVKWAIIGLATVPRVSHNASPPVIRK